MNQLKKTTTASVRDGLDCQLPIGIREAIAFWAADASDRQQVRERLFASGHLEKDPELLPLLWLRLFLECGIKVAPEAMKQLFDTERDGQKSDTILLYQRKKARAKGPNAPHVGVAVERFPGRRLIGFTTLELLFSEAPKIVVDARHWPYFEDWHAVVRHRDIDAAPRTRSTEYVNTMWRELGPLLTRCLELEAHGRAETRLVEASELDQDGRRFRTELKLQDLADQLQQRHAELRDYSPKTMKYVVQTMVKARRGRPISSAPRGAAS